jgi:hypothetical protein
MGGVDGQGLQAVHHGENPVFDVADLKAAWDWLQEPAA